MKTTLMQICGSAPWAFQGRHCTFVWKTAKWKKRHVPHPFSMTNVHGNRGQESKDDLDRLNVQRGVSRTDRDDSLNKEVGNRVEDKEMQRHSRQIKQIADRECAMVVRDKWREEQPNNRERVEHRNCERLWTKVKGIKRDWKIADWRSQNVTGQNMCHGVSATLQRA